jgi:hypothetical protein
MESNGLWMVIVSNAGEESTAMKPPVSKVAARAALYQAYIAMNEVKTVERITPPSHKVRILKSLLCFGMYVWRTGFPPKRKRKKIIAFSALYYKDN